MHAKGMSFDFLTDTQLSNDELTSFQTTSSCPLALTDSLTAERLSAVVTQSHGAA